MKNAVDSSVGHARPEPGSDTRKLGVAKGTGQGREAQIPPTRQSSPNSETRFKPDSATY